MIRCIESSTNTYIELKPIHYLQLFIVMNKKTKNKVLVDAMGSGAREAYLLLNPHGFSAVTKVHKSSKNYNRKQNKVEAE